MCDEIDSARPVEVSYCLLLIAYQLRSYYEWTTTIVQIVPVVQLRAEQQNKCLCTYDRVRLSRNRNALTKSLGPGGGARD